MAFTLRLPPEMEAEINRLKDAHNRSLHGEVVHALSMYIQRCKVTDRINGVQVHTDSLFAQGSDLKLYMVYYDGSPVVLVWSDSADNACAFVCAGWQLSRLSLHARPEEDASDFLPRKER